ncbi:FadR/GntR family transcriptional regulator [Gordonia sp. DT219]|uniref:FadR/GntR family transcriptional regulator n=1 Tax=Gordonia sp. DT219 TaxID=3416658 RepID=UPI003CEF09CB
MNTQSFVHHARSASSAVGAYIERLIDTELSPGDRLPPERELADQLHVSRGTVRTALRELEERGRIARSPGRGTTVLRAPAAVDFLTQAIDVSTAERTHASELRLLIEPQIAGLAAERATETDFVRMEQALSESHAGLTPAESLELDMRFHNVIAAASGNPLLVSLCELTNEMVRSVRLRSHSTRAGRRRSVEGHQQLLRAITDHDVPTAVAAMRDHLGDVARLVEESS